MIEHGDVHGRNAVDGRAPLGVDGARARAGSKYSITTMAAPQETELRVLMTQPKQWNRGTWMRRRSRQVRSRTPQRRRALLTIL
jgi:hypothetical protein